MAEEQTADYKIRSLERMAQDIQEAGLLTRARQGVQETDVTLSMLPSRLGEARTKGYVFKNYLEGQIASLQTQWGAMRTDVQLEVDRRVRDLQDELRRVEPAIRRLQPHMGQSLDSAQAEITAIEMELSSVDRQVSAALAAVEAMYDTVRTDVSGLRSQVDECLELVTTMDQASFGFQPGEAGVAVVKARWLKDGRKEGPKGVLFLTDRRLIYEQRERVATRKLLFIATASEEVKELLWEAPIGALVSAEATETRQALILKREQLTLVLKHPSPVREVLLQLEADSEAWRALINRVVSGDIDQERVTGAGGSAAQKALSAVPTKCPSCGASLDLQVVRGMSAVKCAFCGTSVPLAQTGA